MAHSCLKGLVRLAVVCFALIYPGDGHATAPQNGALAAPTIGSCAQIQSAEAFPGILRGCIHPICTPKVALRLLSPCLYVWGCKLLYPAKLAPEVMSNEVGFSARRWWRPSHYHQWLSWMTGALHQVECKDRCHTGHLGTHRPWSVHTVQSSCTTGTTGTPFHATLCSGCRSVSRGYWQMRIPPEKMPTRIHRGSLQFGLCS